MNRWKKRFKDNWKDMPDTWYFWCSMCGVLGGAGMILAFIAFIIGSFLRFKDWISG